MNLTIIYGLICVILSVALIAVGINYQDAIKEQAKLREELAQERSYINTLVIRRSDKVSASVQGLMWRDNPFMKDPVPQDFIDKNEGFFMKIDGVEIDFSQASISVSQYPTEAFITITNLRFKEGK